MYYSKNNIIVEIENSVPAEYVILNPLTGSFDLMSQYEHDKLQSIKNGIIEERDREFIRYLYERGYLFINKSEEDKKVKEEYEKFQEEMENSQTQLLLIPTYGCNLACTYCYEHGIEGKNSIISREVVDAFFDYANNNFKDKKIKPFITLFGGEPLVNSPAQREIIEYIIEKCIAYDYEVAAVTNGFDLADYVDLIKRAKVKEVQVTLDGSRDVHDQRRGTANGRGTFDRIIQGIDRAVESKIPINLRSVVDKENMSDLVNLAEFLDSKGWLDLGQDFFKTQIGRNYELFECYAKPQHLMAQAELWGEFAKLSKEYTILKKLHRPDFKGIRHLVDTGEMYMASFDTCPATKTEWVFDYYGDIYGCTASCGREEYKLGTFYPEVTLNEEPIKEWQSRDVLNIEECRDCSYNIICGGGCGVVAANKSKKVLSPDCRPIGEMLEIGVSYYKEDILSMASEEEAYRSGCMICGEELIYTPDKPTKVTCYYCKKEETSYAVCKNGHYVCDDCHRKDVLSLVEDICINTSIKDPVELANRIFELPRLNMHGPEYHSIVPVVITTAYGNTIDNKNVDDIRMAIERGREIKGGACGTYGACGAAIGAGIGYSVINAVTPISRESRGNANRITAEALMAISELGGPRCCKRESILSLKAAKKSIKAFDGVEGEEYICRQFKENKDCLGVKCPFFPNVKNKN